MRARSRFDLHGFRRGPNGQPFSTAPINHSKGSGVAATVGHMLMEGLSLEPSLHTGNLQTTSPLRPTVPLNTSNERSPAIELHS